MTILDDIVATKRREIAEARRRTSVASLRVEIERMPRPRDFLGVLTKQPQSEVRLIAEVKKASPSAGLLRPEYDPAAIARIYSDHGASAVSVLTDRDFFQGRLSDIAAVKRAVELPVLRKDFVIDEFQVCEARAAGADAVLLIAECLDDEALRALADLARELLIAVLVEVHSQENLRRVLNTLGTPATRGYLLGINNRDLTTQRTNLATMSRLAAELPPGTRFVAESGIQDRAGVRAASEAGACAVLVGEALLRAPDVGAKINELLGRSDP